jgi:hypothetical protein
MSDITELELDFYRERIDALAAENTRLRAALKQIARQIKLDAAKNIAHRALANVEALKDENHT